MKRINFYLMLIVVMVLVVSCQKNWDMDLASETSESPNQEAKVIDGVLHIPTQKMFREITEKLVKERSALESFERNFTGFVSMKMAFSKLNENDAENITKNGVTDQYKGFVSVIGEGETQEITRTITDPILATLVNKDGLLVIENKIHKFHYDKFYAMSLQSSTASAGFDEKTIGVSLGKVAHRNSPNAKIASSTTCIQEYWVGGNKRRLAGDVDYTEYYLNGGLQYKNVTVYTKHQKRVLGTSWWTMDTGSLSLTGSIKIHNVQSLNTGIWGTQFTYQINQSCNNCGLLQEPFGTNCPNAGCAPTYSNINTTNSGMCTDGQYRSCSISL
jgi:hypothetical protein